MAMENLATATQSDRTSVALLTKKIAELSNKVNTLTVKLATAQSENARLKIFGHRSANAGSNADHRHRSANVGPPSDQNPLRDQNIYSRSGKSLTPTGIVHLTGLRSRKPILPQLAATSLMDITNCRRDWKLREEKNVTSIGSMADQPREGGRD